jgi:feruloyl esterase
MDFGSPQQFPIGEQWFGTPCTHLIPPIIQGVEVVKITATEVHNFSYPALPSFNPINININNLNFCNVSVTLTHPGANDTVYVTVWLPLSDSAWNGRYQATGGGGLAAGIGELRFVPQVAAGYAASFTDGGLTLDNTVNPQSGQWALKEDGSPNEELQLNLAWRSIHDMAVVSKDVIKQFYGIEPAYSYWHGCSQGGRQGYAAAAKYPHDFDGILAISPAIDIAVFAPADFWPPVVMQNSEVPPFCVFEAYQRAIIAECDPLDGVADGLISDYELLETCPFDPASLVGTEIPCTDDCKVFDPETLVGTTVPCRETSVLTITTSHAEVVSKILQGPRTPSGDRLWYGVAPGASFIAVAQTVTTDDGTLIPEPFTAAENWTKFLALQNSSFDMTKMTYAEFYQAFDASVSKLTPLWGNQQLDLSDFREAGGKLLTWFGLADEYIPPSGMLRYRDSVVKKFGGAEAVDEFYRLFLAPGAGHCFGGHGPVPNDPLEALVSWVEKGNAPEVLAASSLNSDGVKVTRNLCRYPQKLVYQEGDVNQASSFSCQ